MTVLHLISSLNAGGAERLMVDLAIAQKRNGTAVRVVTMSAGGPLAAQLRAAGVQFAEFETRTGSPASRARNLIRLCRALSTDKAAVVHAWMYHAGVLATLCSSRRARVVIGVHHDDPSDHALGGTARIAALLARLSRRASSVVYVSESARSKHESHGWSGAPGCVIAGGVDAERFVPREVGAKSARPVIDIEATADTPVIVAVSRFHPDKDPFTMVRAFAAVRERRADVRLWLVGPGFDAANTELESLIAQLGVTDSVVLLGPSSTPERVLAEADVVAVSSRTESFGLALLEGLLSGLSAASTSVGIAPLLLEPERLSEAGDAIGLAAALEFAIEHRDPERSRATALPYSLTAMRAAYDEIYRDALA